MGLDNGIMVKINNSVAFGAIPAWVAKGAAFNIDDNIDVQYWRKCWNVRDIALEYLEADGDGGEFEMDWRDIIKMNKHIKTIYNKASWDDHGRSIWEWSEIGRHYKRQMRYANKVARWLASKPADSYTIVFYDSY